MGWSGAVGGCAQVPGVRAFISMTLRTLCTRCQVPLVCEWPDPMEFGGEMMPAAEAMARSIRNPFVYIACDKCLGEMPDVKLEDMRLA